MKTAFVTGATGFLGRNLVEQLLCNGWEVTALHRPTSDLRYLRPLDIHLVPGDLADEQALVNAVPRSVDAVFHVAANTTIRLGDAAQQYVDNVGGTINVIKAALARGAKRLIYTSSWNAWGWALGIPVVSESVRQRGVESWIPYDRTKALAEQEVRKAVSRGLDAIIMNPAHIIGRYDRHNWARFIVLINNKRFPVIPPGTGSFSHAVEVARAHIAAVEQGTVGDNYLLGGVNTSFLHLAQTIAKMLDRPVPRITASAAMVRLMANFYQARSLIFSKVTELTPVTAALVSAESRIESDKAYYELGYRKVSLESMLEDSIKWLKSEGILS